MTPWRNKIAIAAKPDRGDSAGMSESPEMPALVVAADEAAAMNATRVAARRRPETLRWGGCLALALGIHAAGAAVLLGWGETPDLVANAPIIMIELATLIRQMTGSRSEIIHEPLPKDDPVRRNPNIDRAQKLLGGWGPKVPLEDGIAATIEYFGSVVVPSGSSMP